MYHTESNAVLLPSVSMASDMSEVERCESINNRITINASPAHSVINMSDVTSDDYNINQSSSFYIGDAGSGSFDLSSSHNEKKEDPEAFSVITNNNSQVMNVSNNSNEGVTMSGDNDCSKIQSILNEAKNKLLAFCPDTTFAVRGYEAKKMNKNTCLNASDSNAHILCHVDTNLSMNDGFDTQSTFLETLNTQMTPLRGNNPTDLTKEKKKQSCFVSPFVMEMLFSTIGILLSSSGNFAAGLILDYQQKFTVYHQIPELIYLVPTLLGLKGNLEMTMVARLCTMANMGQLRSFKSVVKVMYTNVSMVQSQAILVSFIASAATLFTTMLENSFSGSSTVSEMVKTEASAIAETAQPSQFIKFLVVLTTSLWTSNIACLASS